MNFALALSGNRIPGTRVDLNKLADNAALATQAQAVEQYAKLLLRGEVSAQTRATIEKSLRETQMAENKPDAAKIVGLLLGSPEFQRQ
jgi:uncharacterized protein YoaH (UPF0181 family)